MNAPTLCWGPDNSESGFVLASGVVLMKLLRHGGNLGVTSQPRLGAKLPLGQFHLSFSTVPIGRGGLGSVYSVVVTASNAAGMPVGSKWAAKKLNYNWKNHPVMTARFEREILALRSMSHPNIVTCHGENLPGGERFYVMPLFANSVRKHIAMGGLRGNWREIAKLGAELADALQYAHRIGFIHRDLKPDNILFNPSGPLVIADWGLGYFVHRESLVLQQLTRGRMGTEYYCSIEQWSTGKCDCRGDIYSLGMTLDEWVTGRQRVIEIGMGVDGPATLDPCEGAVWFNKILWAMTQMHKTNRPGSMSAVAASLRGAART